MTFQSILNGDGWEAETTVVPACFADLNLDQIVGSITSGKQEYRLAPFFYQPLKALEAIAYRQAVMNDLQSKPLFTSVTTFAKNMRSVREHIIQSEAMHYKHQKEAWLLDALDIYSVAVDSLFTDLKSLGPSSEGFVGLISYLSDYVNSVVFRDLVENISLIKKQLASVRYSLIIDYGGITVTLCNDELDYSAEIQADFAKFKQGLAKDHAFKFDDPVQMNHIEAGVLERVALLFPEIFSALDTFASRSIDRLDPIIVRFDREVQFYVAYLEYMRRLKKSGLRFCTPNVSNELKQIHVSESFDASLATVLIERQLPVITNEFYLDGRERIIIVSGPNQGGKTTFARMFGQLHYLASLGCPVPGAMAQLFLFDQIFTHFEREEDIHNLRGKLHDDLFRLHETLSQATSRSIIIMNEVFNSTSLTDAVFLSTKTLEKIIELDVICVCVTFIDELAKLSDSSVTMASNVNPDNLVERTYKIVRRAPDGLAYALSIAEKYGLTHTQLRERLKP